MRFDLVCFHLVIQVSVLVYERDANILMRKTYARRSQQNTRSLQVQLSRARVLEATQV